MCRAASVSSPVRPDPEPPTREKGVVEGAPSPTKIQQVRRWSLLLRRHREVQFARAALVGLGAGAVAVLFQKALSLAEGARASLLSWLKGFPEWGWAVLPLVAAVLAGIAGWLTSRYAPEAAGSGIPHLKGVLLQVRRLSWRRLLPVKFTGGVLAIGAGLSLGREGPTVQMGAAVGQAVGQMLKVPRRSRSHLMSAGAGAGLAAAFNAPLAGFIFTIEELHRELSPLTYGTALIGAVVADIVARSWMGQLPSFHISGYPMPDLTALPLFAILGLVTGLMAAIFNRALLRSLQLSHRLERVPAWAKASGLGAVAGLVAWWLPEAVGGGHSTAERILRGEYASLDFLPFLAVLFLAKFALTVASYGTGVPGGIFAPMLVLGASIGLMVGQISFLCVPGLAHTPAAFAVVGMASAFAAIVGAPLTGIVLILEMTGNYEQLFPLLVACMVAFLTAERLRVEPIYEALLQYDLQRTGAHAGQYAEHVMMDVTVEPHSPMDGRRVRNLGLPRGCLLVLIRRGGREIVPGGETRLRPGDQLQVVVAGDISHACALIREAARSVS